VRKSRAEAIQASAADTRISLHLPDGKKQQERDEKIRLASKGQGPNPDKVRSAFVTVH
jgi:salicylate hydroxylase